MIKKIVNAQEVFTPAIQAVKTFVERDDYTTNILVDSLKTLGKQIVLYGHSGSGKSTLLRNKLNQVYEFRTVTTRCISSMTYENVIYDAFDQLDIYFSEEKSKTQSTSFNATFDDFIGVKVFMSKIGFSFSSDNTNIQKRLLPPQLTPQRLAKYFGELKVCWILEDFHKIKGEEKIKLSQTMKVFVDKGIDYPDLKIIALGAVNSARDVIAYDGEMSHRVSEIYVGLMKDEQIKEIIFKGEKLLNIFFNSEVVDKIVKISNGIPAIAHQLCLNICFIKEINYTSEKSIFINDDDFMHALIRYIDEKSDTLKAKFDRAIKHEKNIIIKPEDVLKVAINIKKHEFTAKEIISKMDLKNEDELASLNILLNDFTTTERSEILVYDTDSGKYYFSDYFLRSFAVLKLDDDHYNIENNKDLKLKLLQLMNESDLFISKEIVIDDAEKW